MCLMCEEEAFHRAYMEYMARKEADATAKDGGKAAAAAGEKFKAEDVSAAPSPAPKT